MISGYALETDFVVIYSVSAHFDDIRIRLGSRFFKESLASTYILPGMRAAVRLPTDAEIYEKTPTVGVQRALAPMCEAYSQKRQTSSDSAKLASYQMFNQ